MQISNLTKPSLAAKTASSLYLSPIDGARVSLSPSFYSVVKGVMAGEEIDDDIADIAHNIKVKAALLSDISPERLLIEKWDELNSDTTPLISVNRIHAGIKHGLIDHVNGALLKTMTGWINQKNQAVLPVDAAVDELVSYVKKQVDVAELVTLSDAKQFMKNGTVSVGGEVVASRERENDQEWKIARGGKIKQGIEEGCMDFIKRLLSHSDAKVFFPNEQSSALYHGTVSADPIKSELSGDPLSTSRKGMATYCTKSLYEAISVYANPMSMDQQNKRYGRGYKGVSYETPERNSHLHVISPSEHACHYHARMSMSYLTHDELPSPHALGLYFSTLDKDTASLAKRMQNKVYLAANSYEVYSALSSINEAILETGKGQNTDFMPSVISAMGYNGLDIDFPEQDFLRKCREIQCEIKDGMPDELSLFKFHRISERKLGAYFQNYLRDITEGVPDKGMDGHVIFFDTKDGFVIEKSVELPLHNAIVNQSWELDPFYDSPIKDFMMMPEAEIIECQVKRDSHPQCNL